MKPKKINWRSKWYTWLFVPTKTVEKFEDLVFFISQSIQIFHQQLHQKFSYYQITHGNYF